jgi:hypothetical protein
VKMERLRRRMASRFQAEFNKVNTRQVPVPAEPIS